MYIYIYICIYIIIYIHILIYIYICIYTYKQIPLYIHTHIYTFICIYIYIYMYVSISVHAYMKIHILSLWGAGRDLPGAVFQVDLPLSIQGQLLYRNVQRSGGGLVFKAHRLLHHSTPGSRAIKKMGR